MNNVANRERIFRLACNERSHRRDDAIFPMPSQRGKRSIALMAAVPTIPPIKGANAESTTGR
jgi:hypothetical protein